MEIAARRGVQPGLEKWSWRHFLWRTAKKGKGTYFNAGCPVKKAES
jgi:hypothetical protein